MLKALQVKTSGQGLYEITDQVLYLFADLEIEEGLCNLFVQHTSCSLTIQENADPSAKRDLESWIKREVPENHPDYTHVDEGDDDMPSHIKSVITGCSLTIPVQNSRLLLGIWQGIYLWEHRKAAHNRKVIVAVVHSSPS